MCIPIYTTSKGLFHHLFQVSDVCVYMVDAINFFLVVTAPTNQIHRWQCVWCVA